VDAPAVIVNPPVVALELHATSIGESFKVKPPDLIALDVCLKGVTFVCSCWSVRLAAKCRGGTHKLSVPYHCLLSKVVLRLCMACPRSCSLRPLHGGASCGVRSIAAAPNRSGVSGGFLQSVWRNDVAALYGHVICRE
jgi:hypothetical protein